MKINEKLTQDLREQMGNLSDLNTTDKSSLVNAINYTLPTILYENANGSNGNITLNDNVDNYSAIEIYYKSDGDGNVMMTKVVSPFTRAALITTVVNLSGQYQGIFFRLAQVALSSNQLTVEKNGQLFGNGSSVNNGSTNNNVRIIKILGYKY